MDQLETETTMQPSDDELNERTAGLHQVVRQKSAVVSKQLEKVQRRYGLAVTILPFTGFVLAAFSLWFLPLGSIEIGLLAGMYILTLLGINIGFHRYFAHNAFKTNSTMRIVFAVLGSMAAQGHIIHWVSNHRRHHQYSDRPGDPHSPHCHEQQRLGGLHGLWYAQVSWMYKGQFPNILYAKDLLRDPMITRINKLYLVWVCLGLAIPAGLGGLLSGSAIGAFQGFLWGGLVRIFLVHHATGTINSICHAFGDRPFQTDEHSKNNIWLAIPTLGESWHNNHHAFPNSARSGLQWWQLDLGYGVIRLLEWLGLVWDVKTPTASAVAAKQSVMPEQ
jgi:stearoyl-CoA desaturase (Delta-9 desaturase)